MRPAAPPHPHRRPAAGAALACLGALLLAGCATGARRPLGPDGIVPRSEGERTRLTLSSRPAPPARACVLEPEPLALPEVAALLDETQLAGELLQLRGALGAPTGTLLLSVGYGATGRPDWFHLVETTLADSALAADLARLVDRHLFRQPPGEPFGVRLRVTVADVPGVEVGRREVCFPTWAEAPAVGTLDRDPGAPRAQNVVDERDAAVRVFLDEAGTVQDAYVLGRAPSRATVAEVVAAVERSGAELPALLDGRPTGYWFTLRQGRLGEPTARYAGAPGALGSCDLADASLWNDPLLDPYCRILLERALRRSAFGWSGLNQWNGWGVGAGTGWWGQSWWGQPPRPPVVGGGGMGNGGGAPARPRRPRLTPPTVGPGERPWVEEPVELGELRLRPQTPEPGDPRGESTAHREPAPLEAPSVSPAAPPSSGAAERSWRSTFRRAEPSRPATAERGERRQLAPERSAPRLRRPAPVDAPIAAPRAASDGSGWRGDAIRRSSGAPARGSSGAAARGARGSGSRPSAGSPKGVGGGRPAARGSSGGAGSGAGSGSQIRPSRSGSSSGGAERGRASRTGGGREIRPSDGQ